MERVAGKEVGISGNVAKESFAIKWNLPNKQEERSQESKTGNNKKKKRTARGTEGKQ
jgi:hypothetical protein